MIRVILFGDDPAARSAESAGRLFPCALRMGKTRTVRLLCPGTCQPAYVCGHCGRVALLSPGHPLETSRPRTVSRALRRGCPQAYRERVHGMTWKKVPGSRGRLPLPPSPRPQGSPRCPRLPARSTTGAWLLRVSVVSPPDTRIARSPPCPPALAQKKENILAPGPLPAFQNS